MATRWRSLMPKKQLPKLRCDTGVLVLVLVQQQAVPDLSASFPQRALSPGSEEFPSLITMQVLPRVTDSSPAKRLVAQLLSTIRNAGTFRPSEQGQFLAGSWSHPLALQVPQAFSVS